VLGAVGGKQQKFGKRRDVFFGFEKRFASTSSKGCAEGWGYYVDDPDPVCEPLDKIGQGPSQDVGFCAALGCPYNPPNLPSPSPDIEDGDQEIEEGKVEGNSVSEEQKQK
jgi:hypothetical protein